MIIDKIQDSKKKTCNDRQIKDLSFALGPWQIDNISVWSTRKIVDKMMLAGSRPQDAAKWSESKFPFQKSWIGRCWQETGPKTPQNQAHTRKIVDRTILVGNRPQDAEESSARKIVNRKMLVGNRPPPGDPRWDSCQIITWQRLGWSYPLVLHETTACCNSCNQCWK